MKRHEFMAKLYKEIQEFETRWNEGQRGNEPENWPDDLPEQEWWDQLAVHLDID